jgi:hypothetical protein
MFLKKLTKLLFYAMLSYIHKKVKENKKPTRRGNMSEAIKKDTQRKMTREEKDQTIKEVQEDLRRRNRRSSHADDCSKEKCLDCNPTSRCL